MVMSLTIPNSSELVEQVPQWIATARKEGHRALGELELGVRRAIDEAAAAVSSRATLDSLPAIADIQDQVVPLLATIEPLMEVLSDRMVETLGTALKPLDAYAAALGGVPEASIRAARAGWDRAIRAYLRAVAQYVAGFVEGGGLALALWTELPPDLACHTGEVSSVLEERLSFIPKRAEAVVSVWLSEVRRETAELFRSTLRRQETPASAAVSPTPPVPAAMQTVLPGPGQTLDAKAVRLNELLAFAKALRVRLKQLPETPDEAFLVKMADKLVAVAQKKGVAVPAHIAPGLAEQLDAAVTLHVPPRTESDRTTRVEALLERATAEGLDLGRVPAQPSTSWIVVTEAKLQAAVSRKRGDRASRKHTEIERRQRIERLMLQANQLGVRLDMPHLLTEDWLAKAELQVTAIRLDRGPPQPETGKVARFTAVRSNAAAARVDLGLIPRDPDEVWLTWAETRVRDATALLPVEPATNRLPVPVLVFQEGTVQEHEWPVSELPLTIGRGRDNGIQVRDDAGVSRKHCLLVMRAGDVVVRDQGSTMGTFVDGERVSEAVLRAGQTVLVGETPYILRFR